MPKTEVKVYGILNSTPAELRARVVQQQEVIDAVRKQCESVIGTYSNLADLEDRVFEAFDEIRKLVKSK